MTRKRGTCVLTGLPPGEFPFPLFDVVLNCITVRGSLVGTRQDMAEALAFAAEGKVKADIELQPLSAINQVLERLERGKVAARVVIEFPNSSAQVLLHPPHNFSAAQGTAVARNFLAAKEHHHRGNAANVELGRWLRYGFGI